MLCRSAHLGGEILHRADGGRFLQASGDLVICCTADLQAQCHGSGAENRRMYIKLRMMHNFMKYPGQAYEM